MIQAFKKKLIKVNSKNIERLAFVSRVIIYTIYTPPVFRDFGWDLTIFLWFLILYLEMLHRQVASQDRVIKSMMEADMAQLSFISSHMNMMAEYIKNKEKENDDITQ